MKKVALVGRVNVGKSTLFNRLSRSLKAVAYDFEGVTRDPLVDLCEWQDQVFSIVDTAGLQTQHVQDKGLGKQFFEKTVEELESADLIVFVIDGQDGVVRGDQMLAARLRTLGKPVIVAINKSDLDDAEYREYEAQELGFKEIIKISAAHGRGIEDLLEEVVAKLSTIAGSKRIDESVFSVAFLGRPNVGKSSLLNILLDKKRSLVSDVAGTTREAIADWLNFYKNNIQLVDTAGVRRSRSIDDPLEHKMVGSTFNAVKKSSIVLLLLDATEADIVDQELKLAHYAFDDLYKGLIILWNKTDLLDEDGKEKIAELEKKYRYLFSKCVSLQISCKTGKNVNKVVPTIFEVWKKYSMNITEINLSTLYKAALDKTPLMHSKKPIVLKRAYQVGTAPITIYLKVNEPTWVGQSQRSFFERLLRKNMDLAGVPVKFIIRKN